MHVFGPWQKDRVLRGNHYRYFRVSQTCKLHTTSPLPGFEPEAFLTKDSTNHSTTMLTCFRSPGTLSARFLGCTIYDNGYAVLVLYCLEILPRSVKPDGVCPCRNLGKCDENTDIAHDSVKLYHLSPLSHRNTHVTHNKSRIIYSRNNLTHIGGSEIGYNINVINFDPNSVQGLHVVVS